MHIVKLGGWHLLYSEAEYYGYRHGVIVGPWLIMWGRPAKAD